MQNHTTNEEIQEKIIEALNWRYAVKVFDPNKKISAEDLNTILESARLSPSSNGVEMWKFIVVEDKDTRAKIREAGFDQPKITDTSHLVVLTYRTDVEENLTKERLERTAKIQNQDIENLGGLKSMLENGIAKKLKCGNLEEWVKSQSYIPLGIMIL
ncbi:MAG: nitroreductase family protein, partial [bacterium]|nr:nitroreductase family protein [bacterium]